MDPGTQNIPVDDNFNFLAIIDWEFAQTVPWQVSHYPFPFPLRGLDESTREAPEDPGHVAHKNVAKQAAARAIHTNRFRDAESRVRREGRALARQGSFAKVLDGEDSGIYACLTKLQGSWEQDANHVYEVVNLAFGYNADFGGALFAGDGRQAEVNWLGRPPVPFDASRIHCGPRQPNDGLAERASVEGEMGETGPPKEAWRKCSEGNEADVLV